MLGAHHGLFALFQASVPETVLRRLDLDSTGLVERARRDWDRIRREVARIRPKKVVLSSELFLLTPSPAAFRRFRGLLEELGPAEITVCAYVRAPAAHYLSRVQENAKFSGEVTPPQPLAIREGVDAAEAAFGRKMALRAYDPAVLADGDVVTDFIREIVGAAVPDAMSRGERFNTSLSAEAMSISVASRRINHPGKDQQPVAGHWRLLARIAEVEGSLGGTARPRLRQTVADAVTRSSEDLLWLRDARGIAFPGIDYSAIDGRMPEDVAGLREIAQICEVDPVRREVLLMRLLHDGVEAQGEGARLSRGGPLQRVLSAKARLARAASRLGRPRRDG